jgi:anti-anti-sigma regulatory factor
MDLFRRGAEPRDRVKLRGLYDAKRSDELKRALVPVIKGEISTIDMSDVETIERVALASFVPLVRKMDNESDGPTVRVVGMNDEIRSAFTSTGLSKYFEDDRRK